MSNWARLTNNKSQTPRLERAVMKFDNVDELAKVPKVVKKIERQNITPFARVKKVYYSLDSGAPSQAIQTKKTSYALEDASSKQYYSLD